ncbi:MAG: hypothetical protein IJG05_06490 [Solobacterium sp.]|nr:hypothetical protein [Solobacterium sp.]MBQ6593178.1 hypothetical protein [Solobacterium sp.]
MKKRKKYRLTLSFVATWLFFVSSLMFFGTKLFLHTINNSLSSRIQTIEAQTTEMTVQNDAVRIEIQTLSTRERVDGFAKDNGMSINQDSIITITASAADGE